MCCQGSELLPQVKVKEELKGSPLYDLPFPIAPSGMAVFGVRMFYWSLRKIKVGNSGKKGPDISLSTPTLKLFQLLSPTEVISTI